MLSAELKSKEKLFCTYYSLTRNAREAAVKSGYRLAERTALRLLRKKEIRAFIERLDAERKRSAADIAAGYYRLAFGCVADAVSLLFDDDVTRSKLEQMDLFNVAEIKRPKGGGLEIKFFDRLKALEKLCEIGGSIQNGLKDCSLYSAIEKGAAAISEAFDEQRV